MTTSNLFATTLSGATGRRLLFVLSALPLGVLELVVLALGWSLTAAFAITPLVVVFLMALRPVVAGAAHLERALANDLLDAAVPRPAPARRGGGPWRRAGAVLADPAFWRQQAYLLLRVFVGVPLAIAQLSLLGAGGWLLGLPIYYRWVDAQYIGYRNVDTLPKALSVAPLGIVALVVALQFARLTAAFWPPLATVLLGPGETPLAALVRRRLVGVVVAFGVLAAATVTIVWASTGTGTFWVGHPLAAIALVLTVVVWLAVTAERPRLAHRLGGSRALTLETGVASAVVAFVVAEWALTGRGTFWPGWVLFGLVLALGLHAIVRAVRGEQSGRRRIRELEESRAGAVDVQETELQRIERDLHDGAQARLVALGMSIGLAEEKLRTDPDSARTILAEARTDAKAALQELRDLARGIRPPILTDRGLGAALDELASRSPVPARVDAEIGERPPAPVETTAYFVAAEALTNAIKHAGAASIVIAIRRVGDRLVVDVTDDGHGGADPRGGGLSGLARRVAAFDGTLSVTSPRGGPTTVHAELPCES